LRFGLFINNPAVWRSTIDRNEQVFLQTLSALDCFRCGEGSEWLKTAQKQDQERPKTEAVCFHSAHSVGRLVLLREPAVPFFFFLPFAVAH